MGGFGGGWDGAVVAACRIGRPLRMERRLRVGKRGCGGMGGRGVARVCGCWARCAAVKRGQTARRMG